MGNELSCELNRLDPRGLAASLLSSGSKFKGFARVFVVWVQRQCQIELSSFGVIATTLWPLAVIQAVPAVAHKRKKVQPNTDGEAVR
jgi:hypothetical protein